MNERLKSALLFLLVLLSVVQTAYLLFGRQPMETAASPAYEQLAFGSLRPIDAQMLPEIMLRKEGNWSAVYPWQEEYEFAWEKVKNILPQVQFADNGDPFPDEIDGLILHVRFPQKVNLGVLSAVARFEETQVEAFKWHEHKPLFLWLQMEGGIWQKARLATLPEQWGEELSLFKGTPFSRKADAGDWGSLVLADAEELFLPVEVTKMAPRQAEREEVGLEKLLRSIFVDIALVRNIEERDGALIYTDGQKGLRLFSHGGLELTSPRSEPGARRMEMLTAKRRTAEYMQLKGGWPDYLYLYSLTHRTDADANSRQNNTYTAVFYSAQFGTLVLEEEPPVKLRFSDRGVSYYHRKIWVLGEEAGPPKELMLPAEAAVSVAEEITPEQSLLKLSKVYTVYFISETDKKKTTALPAWVFEFTDGQKAVLDGYNGSLLAWQK